MRTDLKQHCNTGGMVRVTRNRPGCPHLHGYVVGVSRTLCFMRCFYDFHPDGFVVFRLCDVLEVRCAANERHWDRMLDGEGLLRDLNQPARIDLHSMASAIRTASQAYGRLIIECEDAVESIQDFYIGSAVRVSPKFVSMRHFDGLGRWQARPDQIAIEEVTLLQLETPYIQTFWKYLKPSRERSAQKARKPR